MVSTASTLEHAVRVTDNAVDAEQGRCRGSTCLRSGTPRPAATLRGYRCRSKDQDQQQREWWQRDQWAHPACGACRRSQHPPSPVQLPSVADLGLTWTQCLSSQLRPRGRDPATRPW